MSRPNSNLIAQEAFVLLKKKGSLTLDDILSRYKVSVPTAYNVLKIVRALCEQDPNCKVVTERRIKLVYKVGGQPAEPVEGQDEDEEMRRALELLNAQPQEGGQ
mgnify:CR=1 FL=1